MKWTVSSDSVLDRAVDAINKVMNRGVFGSDNYL